MKAITKRPFEAGDVFLMERVFDFDPEKAMDYAKIHEKTKPNVTFVQDGVVLASGGLGVIWMGVAEAWIYISAIAGASIILGVKDQLQEWIQDYDLSRVQAVVRSDWKEGRRFLEWLGFYLEGTMRKFGPHGNDACLYARVR